MKKRIGFACKFMQSADLQEKLPEEIERPNNLHDCCLVK